MELTSEWLESYLAANPDERATMRQFAQGVGVPGIALSFLDLIIHYEGRIKELEKQVEVLRRWV